MSRKVKKTLSVVIACFNEAENLTLMYSRLNRVFKKLPYQYEYLFIDNASTDESQKILEGLARRDKHVKVICMSRNFGSPQPSFSAGMNYMKGDACILLQGDIQDPPECIPQFTHYWEKGFDVVYGIRLKRQGYGIGMNLLYRLFYYTLQKLSYIPIPFEAGDFSLMTKKVTSQLSSFTEYDYYIRGLRAYIGYKQIGVPYVREARQHGRSNENFLSNLWWAKTIIINFSLKPLELISKLAFAVMVLTIILFAVNITFYFIYRDSPRGIPTIVLLILFLGAVQLLSLSVIAEYLAKIFLEVKRRPKYIVEKTINI